MLRRLADRLSGIAGKAATTRVVQHFDELPAHVREEYGDAETTLEGVFDPVTGTVWLVADNLSDAGRAAEVWTHEQLAHHGLRSLLSGVELGNLLKKVWFMLGGMKNPLVADIAERYGLKPLNNVRDRLRVAEEVVGKLAEKRGRGLLTRAEGGMWRKVVEAVRRAWHRMIEAVTGRPSIMDARNIDALLTALERHVMDGTEARGAASVKAGEPAMASKRNANTTNVSFSPNKGKKTDFVTLPNGEKDFGHFPQTGLRDFRLMRAAPIRLQRGVHSISGGYGFIHIERNHGDDIRSAGYGSVQEFVWDLVNNFNEIWEGKQKSFLLLKNNGTDSRPAGFIELERNGTFYSVKNAYPVDKNYPTAATRKLLWKSAPPSSPASGEQTPSNPFTPGIPSQDQTGNLQGQRGQSVENSLTPKGEKDNTPLASLSPSGILGMGVKAAAGAAKAPEIRHFFGSGDLTILQNILQLPHWIAKQHRAFARVYERQLKRMDERAAALKKSLESVPSLFGGKRLKPTDMDSLREMLWAHEGKVQKELEGIEKFLTEDFLETGHETIMVNPRFYDAYRDWLDSLDGTEAAKTAMLEIRKSLDADLVLAHNRMAAMPEMDGDVIRKFRQVIRHVPNYFPHHRYGKYFVQAKAGGRVVFRQHFDAPGERAAMSRAREIVARQGGNYPDAEWTDGRNERLPDEVFDPVDTSAMEQVIRAATDRIGDSERAEEIRELLFESVADTLKSRGWGAHSIRRKGIPGFETGDIVRVLYDYKTGLNGWLTKMEAARDFSEALSGIDSRRTPNLWKYATSDIERFYTVTIPNRMGVMTGSDDFSAYGADVLGVTEAAKKTSFVSSALYSSSRSHFMIP